MKARLVKNVTTRGLQYYLSHSNNIVHYTLLSKINDTTFLILHTNLNLCYVIN